MKKLIICGALVCSLFCLGGWNKQILDLTYDYDEAIIELPNGDIIEGKVDSWTDYKDGDQIQVKVDGDIYLVHSSKIALVKKGA